MVGVRIWGLVCIWILLLARRQKLRIPHAHALRIKLLAWRGLADGRKFSLDLLLDDFASLFLFRDSLHGVALAIWHRGKLRLCGLKNLPVALHRYLTTARVVNIVDSRHAHTCHAVCHAIGVHAPGRAILNFDNGVARHHGL